MKNIFYILLSIFSTIFGYGQVSVLSETNTKDYEVKEAFKLNIGLEIIGNNLEQQTPLKLPDLSKFDILGNASESFTFIDPETGNLVRQIVYQLILAPKQTGKIKIGSALVQVNGKIHKSEAFDIFVKENTKKNFENISRDIHLSMEIQNTNRYLFQPIKIVVKAQSKNFHNLRKINNVQLPQYHNIYPISLKKQDIEIEQSPEEIASQVIASFIIFPENTGNIIIPSTLINTDKEQISSNKLKINIKPLPQNAPKNFKNAVGKFNIEINDSKNIEINKPFDLFVKLSGEGNLNQISLPKILESNNYNIFKPKKSIKTTITSNGLKGEIIEHYILTPKKEGKINLQIEEFVFFNSEKNTYEVIHQDYPIKVSSPIIDKEESTINKIIDDTGHILKKVDLTPISSQEKEKKINWNLLFLLIFPSIIGLLFWILKRKKTNSISNQNKITTISETEEIIKNKLFIEKDYYFRLIKKALDQNNTTQFFEYYEELHNNAIQQIEAYGEKNISKFLETTINTEFMQEYETFREQIILEKYAPIHPNLYEFYTNIVKFYSKIMK